MKDHVLAREVADLREQLQTMLVDAQRPPSQVTGQLLDRTLAVLEHLHVRLDRLDATADDVVAAVNALQRQVNDLQVTSNRHEARLDEHDRKLLPR